MTPADDARQAQPKPAHNEQLRDDMLRFVAGWYRDSSSGLDALASAELDQLQRVLNEARP